MLGYINSQQSSDNQTDAKLSLTLAHSIDVDSVIRDLRRLCIFVESDSKTQASSLDDEFDLDLDASHQLEPSSPISCATTADEPSSPLSAAFSSSRCSIESLQLNDRVVSISASESVDVQQLTSASTWQLTLSERLTTDLRKLAQPSNAHSTVPACMLHQSTPISLLIEYVAAAFGASGVIAGSSVSFTQIVQTEHANQAATRMQQDWDLIMSKLDIDCGKVHMQPVVGSTRMQMSYALSAVGAARLHQRVGIRWCTNKSVQSSIVSLYELGLTARQEQWNRIAAHMRASATTYSNWDDLLQAALVKERESHCIFSDMIPSSQRLHQLMNDASGKLSANRTDLWHQSLSDYIASIDAQGIMQSSIASDCEVEPTWPLRVVDRRNIGEQDVFDLSVTHSSELFVSNGLTIHNSKNFIHRDIKVSCIKE